MRGAQWRGHPDGVVHSRSVAIVPCGPITPLLFVHPAGGGAGRRGASPHTQRTFIQRPHMPIDRLVGEHECVRGGGGKEEITRYRTSQKFACFGTLCVAVVSAALPLLSTLTT